MIFLHRYRRGIFLLAFLISGVLAPGIARAEAAAPAFYLPVACIPGEECWIINYVDQNSAEGAVYDYQCGHRSYDQHDGTDFALPDRLSMEIGVAVLAAADGTVLRVRDEIADKEPAEAEIAEMLAANKGCGNGVLIDHGGGWESIYCHMKQGSISVTPGQHVAAGTPLGQIGQSGAAEVPHLHFGVFRDRNAINPFSGTAPASLVCESGTLPNLNSLWHENVRAALTYQPLDIYAAGFSGAVPSFVAIKLDTTAPTRLGADSDVLAFWGLMFGLREGDQVELRITAPDGSLYARRNVTMAHSRARQFYFIGKENTAPPLPTGTWAGRIQVTRTIPGAAPITRAFERRIELK